jgi:hypothetical protein
MTQLTRQQRQRRTAWVGGTLIARAADGHELDPADIEALPPSFRRDAKRIAEHCATLARGGYRGAARVFAQEEFGELETSLPADWSPPRLLPDKDIVDEIRRGL